MYKSLENTAEGHLQALALCAAMGIEPRNTTWFYIHLSHEKE